MHGGGKDFRAASCAGHCQAMMPRHKQPAQLGQLHGARTCQGHTQKKLWFDVSMWPAGLISTRPFLMHEELGIQHVPWTEQKHYQQQVGIMPTWYNWSRMAFTWAFTWRPCSWLRRCLMVNFIPMKTGKFSNAYRSWKINKDVSHINHVFINKTGSGGGCRGARHTVLGN